MINSPTEVAEIGATTTVTELTEKMCQSTVKCEIKKNVIQTTTT